MKVITNRHRNIGLLVTQGSKWLHIVRIGSMGGLEAEKLTEEQLTGDWAELVYPMEKACAKLRAIATAKGATTEAARLLAVACAELSSEI